MGSSLWSLRAGEQCEIVGYNPLLVDSYRIRLMEFGFTPGEEVTCLQSPAFNAPKVFRVSNTIFSLDDEIAGFIQVRPTAA